MNDVINGIPLPTTNHLTGHQAYGAKVGQILTDLNNANFNMNSTEAYNHILVLTNQIKTHINNYPNYIKMKYYILRYNALNVKETGTQFPSVTGIAGDIQSPQEWISNFKKNRLL